MITLCYFHPYVFVLGSGWYEQLPPVTMHVSWAVQTEKTAVPWVSLTHKQADVQMKYVHAIIKEANSLLVTLDA